MDKKITKALLKNEYIEAILTKMKIEHESDSFMKIQLEATVTKTTVKQIGDLILHNTSYIAIVRM